MKISDLRRFISFRRNWQKISIFLPCKQEQRGQRGHKSNCAAKRLSLM